VIVVADTGPLNYLILIGALDVLPPLYGRVAVPHLVALELGQPGAPPAVAAWIGEPPGWLDIVADPPFDPTLELLDPGESAALTLAQLLDADEL
jgi:predicted nucleic acid-binding protein